MNDKESIVAYPHEIKFIDKNGGTISYYVDRKVSDCVKELQDKLTNIEDENRQKDIDNLQLQSNWNSLREYIKNKDNWYYDIDCSGDKRYIFININDVLDKMTELEGKDKE